MAVVGVNPELRKSKCLVFGMMRTSTGNYLQVPDSCVRHAYKNKLYLFKTCNALTTLDLCKACKNPCHKIDQTLGQSHLEGTPSQFAWGPDYCHPSQHPTPLPWPETTDLFTPCQQACQTALHQLIATSSQDRIRWLGKIELVSKKCDQVFTLWSREWHFRDCAAMLHFSFQSILLCAVFNSHLCISFF